MIPSTMFRHTSSERRPAQYSGSAGFTLIEVLVAMVIIAILAAIAIPNYTQYVLRGHRSEARATLLQAAQWMERFRTQNGTYSGAALPGTLNKSPPSGTVRYNITVTTPAANRYELTATPVATDQCGALTLDQSGARGQGGGTADLCWGR